MESNVIFDVQIIGFIEVNSNYVFLFGRLYLLFVVWGLCGVWVVVGGDINFWLQIDLIKQNIKVIGIVI